MRASISFFCLAVLKCRFYHDSGILRSIDQEIIAFEETSCHLSPKEEGACHGLVRVLSRTFDYISGHRGPAKVTKVTITPCHTGQQRTAPGSAGRLRECEEYIGKSLGYVSEEWNQMAG